MLHFSQCVTFLSVFSVCHISQCVLVCVTFYTVCAECVLVCAHCVMYYCVFNVLQCVLRFSVCVTFLNVCSVCYSTCPGETSSGYLSNPAFHYGKRRPPSPYSLTEFTYNPCESRLFVLVRIPAQSSVYCLLSVSVPDLFEEEPDGCVKCF